MRIINTQILQPDPERADRHLVTLQLADDANIEDALESISLTVRVETENDTPYLKEVQREALTRALDIIQHEIQATKTAPRPAV
ncbi:MAG: hypothetical protein IIA72_02520 [Proteobacteria bacterium]|nr:hypothetical protein [Pseudomonadota bacterium]